MYTAIYKHTLQSDGRITLMHRGGDMTPQQYRAMPRTVCTITVRNVPDTVQTATVQRVVDSMTLLVDKGDYRSIMGQHKAIDYTACQPGRIMVADEIGA